MEKLQRTDSSGKERSNNKIETNLCKVRSEIKFYFNYIMDIIATILNSILSGVLVTVLTKYLIGNSAGFFQTAHDTENCFNHTSESDDKPDSHGVT